MFGCEYRSAHGTCHLWTWRDSDILAENLPHARKLVLPDCGHVAPLEQPQAFNEALIAFLRDHNAHPEPEPKASPPQADVEG